MITDINSEDRAIQQTFAKYLNQLLAALTELIQPMHERWEKEQTRAEVEVQILDRISEVLPIPPYNDDEAQVFATQIYNYIWQRSATGAFPVTVVVG